MPALRRYFLVTTLLLGGLMCGSLTGLSLAAGAHGIGILPPADPTADCTGWAVAGIDRCRAEEGVGRLVLPSNWTRLSPDDQLLVVIDLERVNRGVPPIPVLLRPLNVLAQQGAQQATDPQAPSCNCYSSAGSIWAGFSPPSLLEADQGWMYDDADSHWGHRDIILAPGSTLVAGAGATRHNWTFEVVNGYHSSAAAVTFRWSRELRYFTHRPGREPLGSTGL